MREPAEIPPAPVVTDARIPETDLSHLYAEPLEIRLPVVPLPPAPPLPARLGSPRESLAGARARDPWYRELLDATEIVAVEAVRTAREMIDADPAEQRQIAEAKALEWLQSLEEHYDAIPDAAEPILWHAVRYVVRMMLARVWRRLDTAAA